MKSRIEWKWQNRINEIEGRIYPISTEKATNKKSLETITKTKTFVPSESQKGTEKSGWK